MKYKLYNCQRVLLKDYIQYQEISDEILNELRDFLFQCTKVTFKSPHCVEALGNATSIYGACVA